MAKEGGNRGELRCVFADQETRDDDGDATFGAVEDKRQGSSGFIARPEHIRRSNVAGTNSARVGQPEKARDDDAERNRAEEVRKHCNEGEDLGGRLNQWHRFMGVPATVMIERISVWTRCAMRLC